MYQGRRVMQKNTEAKAASVDAAGLRIEIHGSAVEKAGFGFEPFTQVAGEFVSFGDVAVGGTGGQDDLDDGLVLVIFTDADNQFAVIRIFSFEHHPPAPLLRIVFDSVRK